MAQFDFNLSSFPPTTWLPMRWFEIDTCY